MKIKQGKLVYIYYGIYEILNGTTTVEKNQVSKTVKTAGTVGLFPNQKLRHRCTQLVALHWQARRKNTKHHHANWGGQ